MKLFIIDFTEFYLTIHFIGAGPGDPELITLKAHRIISKSPICLYAGSLIPKKILQYCPKNVKLVDTSKMDLESILTEFKLANEKQLDVARLHSGDLSIWSALGEQTRRLKRENISYTITPGVPSFCAASAILENEFTLPEITQTVILTRTEGKASSMPLNENLQNMAKTQATLIIHLSIQNLKNIITTLIPFYGKSCPAAIVYRATWPDQKVIRGNLGNIVLKTPVEIQRTALIIISKALYNKNFTESSLYSSNYETRFKKIKNYKDFTNE